MLEEKLLIAGLYAKPEIPRRVAYYRQKEARLYSFRQQSLTCQKTDEAAREIWFLQRRREDLGAWANAVIAATAVLSEEEKFFVRLTFYYKLTRTEVMKRMELNESTYGKLRRKTLKKLAERLSLLGFDTKRFLEKFDDEGLFIRYMEFIVRGEERNEEREENDHGEFEGDVIEEGDGFYRHRDGNGVRYG